MAQPGKPIKRFAENASWSAAKGAAAFIQITRVEPTGKDKKE
jgi:hypothetical protein